MSDKIRITILDDGTIKTETDKISMANHANAEGFIRRIWELAGGAIGKTRKIGTGKTSTVQGHQQQGN